MKKRILILTLAVMTFVTSLTGCGETSSQSARSQSMNRDNKIVETKENDDDNDNDEEVKHIAKKYRSKMGNGEYDYGVVMTEACTAEEAYDGSNAVKGTDNYVIPEANYNTEKYSSIDENGFKKVTTSPLSTFGADVDTASYANVRRFINNGYGVGQVPTGAVRTEEMLNYFSYDYDGPVDGDPFGVNAEISECPWNPDHQLVMIGLQTEEIDFSQAPESNIVFLVDVSGSMNDENKLPLLKKAFGLMVDNLTEKDKVSIVTYANGTSVVIEGVPASDKETIMNAFDSLEAGGGTNGAGGIVSAYEIAEDNYIKGGNNRVIIATDGDFNVGLTSQSDLEDLISEEKENNIFLSVIGFGMGNYSDSTMETLADKGNGNYAYIDNLAEAKKVLVDELGANMVICAKDVKFQTEFNPQYVAEYRLIGYEDRALADEDFDDDKKDGGEIGSGHSVTVMYEIVPADGAVKSNLKYQDVVIKKDAKKSDEWLTLSVRYKDPDKDSSKLLEYAIGNDSYNANPSDDFRYAACVVEYSEILRNGEFTNGTELEDVLDQLEDVKLNDAYKQEFYEIVRKTINNSK